MMNRNQQHKLSSFLLTRWAFVISIVFVLSGCSQFLEIDPPKSKIASKAVFENEATAVSAAAGMYIDMLAYANFASGSSQSVTGVCGLSADEFLVFDRTQLALVDFEQNTLKADNPLVQSLWSSMYNTIYQANSLYEGLMNSESVMSSEIKNQLLGEALFVRAFCHFYLVNLFGDAPLILTTDYVDNATAERVSERVIYEQVERDLLKAKEYLGVQYPTSGRERPNKYSASALLARIYLYQKRWEEAKSQSDEVIGATDTYSLQALNQVFITDNKESIWQLRPIYSTSNTQEGYDFIITPGAGPKYYVLSESLVGSFEQSDDRRSEWVGEVNTDTDTLYYPFKYKLNSSSFVVESSVVLRLAEQYLIRAEALVNMGDLESAIRDVDIIRNRAGLMAISEVDPGIEKEDLLLRIEQERRVEFFTEWGHRWLDLKRTGHANTILSSYKELWTGNSQLYPVPKSEFLKNPRLGLQNPGY